MSNRNSTPVFFSVILFAAIPASAQLPSHFDLRDVSGQNYVSGVRSQSGGTCWTHGAMAAMEGNLMISGEWSAAGESGEPDLAEYHLDWWNGFNDNNNDDIDPPSGSGLEIHQGGDYRVTSAYLSRGEGAVRDIDGQSYDVPPARNSSSYHYFIPRDIVWMMAGEDLSNIDEIKQSLMDYGVVGTCMAYDESFLGSGYVHYQPASSTMDPNHAVAIVGWDDTKAVSGAPGPGAWIVKNSWGSSWGLDGYFWISYWDKHCGKHPEMGAVSFRGVARPDWERVYYHDYHGWRDTWNEGGRGFSAFTAAGDESLEKVSFFTTAAAAEVNIRIWASFSGNELSGLLGSQSTTIGDIGFHIVNLSEPVDLEAGEDFYVEIELSAGGMAFDRTAEVPVLLGAKSRVVVESSAQAGESFVRTANGWVDFTSIEASGDLCIKAMSSTRGLGLSEESNFRASGPGGGPFSPSSATYTLQCHGSQPISWEVHLSGGVDWLEIVGPSAGTLSPGETTTVTLALSSSADTLDPGAYLAEISFVNTVDHAGDTTRNALLLVGSPDLVYGENMDVDPGWQTEGQWAWGQPEGLGGEHGAPDPASGATGLYVYGYNLAGDYTNHLAPQSLSTAAIDCSGLYGLSLHFKRWLGVEQPSYDHASLSISTDGAEWMTLWENGEEINDGRWVDVDLDLPEAADDSGNLRIRWTMGSTDGGWTYCGWNIDDVEITGYRLKSDLIFGDGFESGGMESWSWSSF